MACKKSNTKRIIFITWDWLWNATTRREEWVPFFFYEHQPSEVLILDEVVDITIKDKKIIGGTIIVEK
jgi:hypothetical protein